MQIILIVFLALIGLIVWGLISLILRILEKIVLKKKLIPVHFKWKVRIGILCLIFIIAWLLTFRAFHPSKDFFISEWKMHTEIELPKDSKIIARYASYPDFHGDYCAAVVFELNEKDYNFIKTQILNNESYSDSSKWWSDAYSRVLKNASISDSEFDIEVALSSDIAKSHHFGLIDNKRLIVFHTRNF